MNFKQELRQNIDKTWKASLKSAQVTKKLLTYPPQPNHLSPTATKSHQIHQYLKSPPMSSVDNLVATSNAAIRYSVALASDEEDTMTPAEKRTAGYIVGGILGGIIVPVLLYFTVMAIYGFIRFKIWLPWRAKIAAWKTRRTERRERTSRRAETDFERGGAPPPYTEFDTGVINVSRSSWAIAQEEAAPDKEETVGDTVQLPDQCHKNWLNWWRTKLRGTEDIYP